MQYKKEEVRNKLIEVGEHEFFEYGFEKASIRRIVKNAGTTIGNFYNYFENKEMLFEIIVKDEFENFVNFFNNNHNVERPDFLWETSNAYEWRRELSNIVDVFMPIFSKKFYLLVAASKGTKFSLMRKQVLDVIKEHYLEHVRKLEPVQRNREETADVIAHEFLEGILYIIRNYEDETLVQELIKNHLLFFCLGTMALIGEIKGLQ